MASCLVERNRATITACARLGRRSTTSSLPRSHCPFDFGSSRSAWTLTVGGTSFSTPEDDILPSVPDHHARARSFGTPLDNLVASEFALYVTLIARAWR